jgi:hypothetical protein
MMARMTTTSQKKSTTIPGMAYPATALVLTTGSSYPAPPGLFGNQRYRRAHRPSGRYRHRQRVPRPLPAGTGSHHGSAGNGCEGGPGQLTSSTL